MSKKSPIIVLATAVLALVLVSSCGEDGGSTTAPDDGPIIEIETRSGSLDIVEGSTMQASALEVVTFAGASDVGQDGAFPVDAPEADKYQMMLFSSKSSGNPVYIGLYDPTTGEVAANETTTAYALTLMNPYLIYTISPSVKIIWTRSGEARNSMI
jgi:hypothetical protein